QWDLVVSRNTLLRLLRRQPAPSYATPTVLGVDDFALRKRHTYGTILVDLERRQPVALLPDRTAETVAQWLREHPGVEVIARDRSSTYAEGARQGASEAIQVADRFHVLQNLRATLDEVFTTHHHALDTVNAAARRQPVPLPDGTLAVPVPPPPTPARAAPPVLGLPTARVDREPAPRRRLGQRRPPGPGRATPTPGPSPAAPGRGGAGMPASHAAPGDVAGPAA